MATKDQASDRYNPPGNLSQDFEEYWFHDLEVDELFWQTNQPGENIPWRKVNQNQAINLKARTTHNFNVKTKVWQKV